MTEENKQTAPAETGNGHSADAAKKAPVTFKHLLGIKRGMTQIFKADGTLCGVTVVESKPAVVMGLRIKEKDNYTAVQLAYGDVHERNMSKPSAGQFKKAGVPASRWIREIRVADLKGFEIGQKVDIEGRFIAEDYVDVQATSKGHGFAGVMKRHNFRGMPASHGASDKERSPGSLAARRALGRVLPGQRMAGHLGAETVTVQKIEIAKLEPENHLVYLKGSVPGPNGGLVHISLTVKERKHKVEVKKPTVMRDKMGNIIQAKGAKAAAKAQTAAKPAAAPAKK